MFPFNLFRTKDTVPTEENEEKFRAFIAEFKTAISAVRSELYQYEGILNDIEHFPILKEKLDNPDLYNYLFTMAWIFEQNHQRLLEEKHVEDQMLKRGINMTCEWIEYKEIVNGAMQVCFYDSDGHYVFETIIYMDESRAVLEINPPDEGHEAIILL
ncbi:hypothetical protein HYV12_03000 [Candidatus Dojkabacteria bacterium]|nr:hypothetical protein [Candidatus Dojkabacteria bacterium]